MEPGDAARQAARSGDYGMVIRLCRRERGWSQRRLGEACGFDQSAISRLERNLLRKTYDVRALRAVAEALDIPAQLLGLADQIEEPDDGRLQRAIGRPDGLDLTAIGQLMERVDRLRRRRDGSVPLVRLLLGVAPLTGVLRQLLAGSQPEAVRQALCEVAVQTFTFAGSLSFDLRDTPAMASYYRDADTAAHELDDRAYLAFALSSRSMITLHGQQDGHGALELAQRAASTAAAGSSRIVEARCHAILAEIAAATKDGHRSDVELSNARSLVPDQNVDELAASLFGEVRHGGTDGVHAHIDGFEGACHLLLERARSAHRVLERSLAGLPPVGADRQRAIVLADLALTYAILDDLHTAAFLLGQAIGLTARVGGAVPIRRIYRVRSEFDPARHGALLRQLDEQLHATALFG